MGVTNSFRLVFVLAYPIHLSAVLWNSQVNVVPGIMMEKLELPVLYDAFVPAILEYNRPVIADANISTESILERSCSAPKYQEDTPCPTAFFVNQEIQQFLRYFNGTEPNADFESPVYGSHWSWASIEENIKAFSALRSTNDALTTHINMVLDKNPLPVAYLERGIEDYGRVNTTFVNKMMEGFKKEFWEGINADRIDDALLSNAISLYQTKVFQQYVLEIMRWTQAMSDCKSHRIPVNIIPYEKLLEILAQLKINLTSEGYSLSLPETDLMRYYTEQLTTCVATETSVFITVRVPVRSKALQSENWEYFAAHSVPFYLPPDLSTANYEASICVTYADGMYYLRDRVLGRVGSVMCEPNSLCAANRNWMHAFGEYCINAVINQNGRAISDHCTTGCEPIGNGTDNPIQPYIQNVGEDMVAVAGGDFLLKCVGKPDELIQAAPIGSVILTVPVRCRVTAGEKVKPSAPVRTDVKPSIPVQWTNDKALGTFPRVEIFSWSANSLAASHKIQSSYGGQHAVILTLSFLGLIIIVAMVYLLLEVRKLKCQVSSNRSGGMYYVNPGHRMVEEPGLLD